MPDFEESTTKPDLHEDVHNYRPSESNAPEGSKEVKEPQNPVPAKKGSNMRSRWRRPAQRNITFNPPKDETPSELEKEPVFKEKPLPKEVEEAAGVSTEERPEGNSEAGEPRQQRRQRQQGRRSEGNRRDRDSRSEEGERGKEARSEGRRSSGAKKSEGNILTRIFRGLGQALGLMPTRKERSKKGRGGRSRSRSGNSGGRGGQRRSQGGGRGSRGGSQNRSGGGRSGDKRSGGQSSDRSRGSRPRSRSRNRSSSQRREGSGE